MVNMGEGDEPTMKLRLRTLHSEDFEGSGDDFETGGE
jgi:hypothetical protein